MHVSLLRFALQRAADELSAALRAAFLQSDDAEHMQRLGMLRLRFDDLVAEPFRRVHLSELHQPERLVEERGGIYLGRVCRSCGHGTTIPVRVRYPSLSTLSR